MKPTRSQALNAVRTLIEYIGDDPTRPELEGTPERVIKAWEQDWGVGYSDPEFSVTTFETGAYSQMVFMKGISFYSTCAHHMTPFFGTATIAYIPDHKIVGLSKLPRIVRHFAARLQVQEHLTNQIAGFIVENISTSCAVMLEATHLCMVSRGVREPQSITRTISLEGLFLEDAGTQAEFTVQARS